MEPTLVFPHQLFHPHPAIARDRPVWLIEDTLYFGSDPHQPLRFHQHKLMLHRASMRAYADELRKDGYDVTYLDHEPVPIDCRLEELLLADVSVLHLADPVDYLLERRLRRLARRRGIRLVLYDTPMFLTPRDWFTAWFDGRKRYHMADFYTAQRRRMNILVDARGQPAGGRWSFDAENRRRWPAGRAEPPRLIPGSNAYVAEAARRIKDRYPDHPGTTDTFWFPVTRRDAEAALDDFLHHRFRGFGAYEDAITRNHAVLHHSVLTPALNIGLLAPQTVVERTLAYAREHRTPLNDVEGFIRQVIGWREFMRIVYEREGVRQRTSNFWKHTRRLTPAWYDGMTGLDPLDLVIRRVVDHAYCHHIERLMVAGNAMLLAGLHPDEAYRWFMELFIDAYDWVMVPNVYGMSQYADGGLITTKPYLSGSNYLKKMSDIPAGAWCPAWDGLYWSFIARHRDAFAANPRLSMMVRTLDRMNTEKRTAHARAAQAALKRL